jgi:hypothetical protein
MNMENQFYQNQHTEDFQTSNGIRNFLGYLLIICGAALALWVFSHVYKTFEDSNHLASFKKLVSENHGIKITTEGKTVNIDVPEEFFVYGIAIVLLLIVSGIAKSLIYGGTRLLSDSFKKISQRLTTFEKQVSSKIDNLNK